MKINFMFTRWFNCMMITLCLVALFFSCIAESMFFIILHTSLVILWVWCFIYDMKHEGEINGNI